MGLATLLRKLSTEHGVELSDEELEGLGLDLDDEPSTPADVDVLDEVLSGEAAGAVELFLAAPSTAKVDAVEKDGLLWEPIIREGQWAVRPGPGGQKRRSPLRVVAGHSKNQRKQIGLQDVVDAFNDGAIEHVTVPTSHDNKVTENTGFIKALKIAKATVKDKLSGKDKTVAVLMGGYDIRDPEIKQKITLGTIASRSAGLLYDYVNTESGKRYPVALEHVALTNKPWITGMKAFGRKLVKAGSAAPVALSLSDDEPADDDLLAQEDALESIELAATNTVTWDKADDPDWLRGQVSCRLDEARAKKIAAMPQGVASSLSYDYPPRYRCVKARPGLALISDGWGDGANYWTAPISVVDGEVQLDDNLDNWTPTKQAYISDDSRSKGFEPGDEPLADDGWEAPEIERVSAVALAQMARKDKSWSGDASNYTDEQYARATALDRGKDAGTAKERYGLPFKTPDGAISAQGVRSAAAALVGARGGVKGASPEQKRAAARKLLTAAAKVGVDLGDSIKALAGVKKASGTNTSDDNTTPSRGGEHMAGESGATLQLNEEAERRIREAEERARQAEERAERFSADLDVIKADRREALADRNIQALKDLGFTEDKGFSGVLVEVRNLMLADDGGPAVQGDNFADDGNKTGELTLSQALFRVFKAFERTEDGKLKVGESLTQPPEEPGAKLGDDGKPKKDDPKDDSEDFDYSKASQKEIEVHLARTSPGNARAAGIDVEKVLAEADAAEAAAKAGQNGGK